MWVQGELSVHITIRAEPEPKEAFFRGEVLIQVYPPLPRVTKEQIDIAFEEVSTDEQLGAESVTQRVVFRREKLEENHPLIVSYRFLYIGRYRDVYGLAERV